MTNRGRKEGKAVNAKKKAKAKAILKVACLGLSF
jgi:hypothetical protein